MPKKKSTQVRKNKNLKFFKDNGLIKYDLRKKLTTGQKRRVTILESRYALELRTPDKVAIIKVTKKQQRFFAGLGVDLKYGTAIIPKHPDETVKILKNHLIKHNKKRGKKTEIPLLHGDEIISYLEKQLILGKQPNTAITCRFDDDSTWLRAFDNYDDLLKYLDISWPTKDPNHKDKQELITHLKIVRLKRRVRKK